MDDINVKDLADLDRMKLSGTEARALTLLGSGIAPEQVALALGLSPARISQLLSTPEFAEQVAELRYINLSKHNNRDATYDDIEDTLLNKMKDLIPLMYKPGEVLNAIRVINAAKRRGRSAPDSIVQQHTHINLILPTQVIQKFQTNIENQVISVSGQELLTIQSKTLLNNVENKAKKLNHVQLPQTSRANSQFQVTDV